jgi:hypothetical protein
MRRTHVLLIAAGLGLAGVAPTGVDAQTPPVVQQQQQQQQAMRMQQQIQHLNQVMERVSGVQERARQMEQQMLHSMQQLQQTRQMALENAVRIRNQERLHSMAQSVADGARMMHRAMEQLRTMIGDPGTGWDPEMERQMEQLRQHWNGMAGQMEEGLTIMERLRDRIHRPPGN